MVSNHNFQIFLSHLDPPANNLYKMAGHVAPISRDFSGNQPLKSGVVQFNLLDHFEGEPPQLEDFLTMVVNHLQVMGRSSKYSLFPFKFAGGLSM